MAPPKYLDPETGMDYEVPDRTFAPSESILRRLVDGMVKDGKLHSIAWSKEMGRPAFLYYGDRRPPIMTGTRVVSAHSTSRFAGSAGCGGFLGGRSG